MTIIIEYKFDGTCYLATTEINGNYICEASVKSYDVAKEKLIQYIKERNDELYKREPEEVEI